MIEYCENEPVQYTLETSTEGNVMQINRRAIAVVVILLLGTSSLAWAQSPEQFHIMREHGTERPGSCALNYEKRAGTFACAGCGQALFKSKKKFESGTGWPSFNDPEAGAVEETQDRSYGMVRTECHCSRCGSHLGHVFPDGPPPTGLRYCINGVAMNFQPE